MKKILFAVIITIFLMLQLFYYLLINASVKFGYTITGNQAVSIDIGIQQFNYWEKEV
jgi:hypothetical protein